jgi:hypothetical protein
VKALRERQASTAARGSHGAARRSRQATIIITGPAVLILLLTLLRPRSQSRLHLEPFWNRRLVVAIYDGCDDAPTQVHPFAFKVANLLISS